ncbi:amino acid ABC transporter permease [Mesorhizobium sp. CN2-181]|uniref:amino acid ABC transporter permease n=1 Tax=Mesorhizobium yinganensis TaxID=3157707 RepID=UPI0032B818B9
METVIAYLPAIFASTGITLMLFITAALIGATGGLAIAVAHTAHPLLRIPARLIVSVIQGTPTLLQLFVVHYGLAILGLRLPPLISAVVALAIFASGFLGEIWRGAMEAVPRTQWDASRSLGFGRLHAMVLLVGPQALWIALPATVGFLVSLLKTTSLASIIGIVDLTKTGTMVANLSFEPMLVYGIVAAIYFALCWPLSLLSRRLERLQHGAR